MKEMTLLIGVCAGVLLMLGDQLAIQLRPKLGFRKALAVWLVAVSAVILPIAASNAPWALAVAVPLGVMLSGAVVCWRRKQYRRRCFASRDFAE